MTTDPLPRPLARWDGLHLVLDLQRVERHLNHLLAGADSIRDLRLGGAGDAVAAEATVVWKGMTARVSIELAEIRLHHRHLGFRMRRLRALGGLPVPRAAVEHALKALESPILTVYSGQGIVVIDLRRWLPAELAVRVVTVQAMARSLHLWFGAGELVEVPARGRDLLPADTGSD